MVLHNNAIRENNYFTYNQKNPSKCTICGSDLEIGRACPHHNREMNWEKLITNLERYYLAKENYYNLVRRLYSNIL